MAIKRELSIICRCDELAAKLKTIGELFPDYGTREEREQRKPDDKLFVLVQDVPEGWRTDDGQS